MVEIGSPGLSKSTPPDPTGLQFHGSNQLPLVEIGLPGLLKSAPPVPTGLQFHGSNVCHYIQGP